MRERAADIKSCPQVRSRRSIEDVSELVRIPNIFNSERTTERQEPKERRGKEGRKVVEKGRKKREGGAFLSCDRRGGKSETVNAFIIKSIRREQPTQNCFKPL